jgi:hypothetical protein
MADKPSNPLVGIDPTPVLVFNADKKGDHIAARQLLSMASTYILEGKPVPEGMRNWLGNGLQKISEGEDTKKVFKHVPKSGRPAQHREEFQRLVAEHIRWSELGLHKGMNADGTGMGAYLDASIRFDIAENTAEKYYKVHIESILEEEKIRQELAPEHETE